MLRIIARIYRELQGVEAAPLGEEGADRAGFSIIFKVQRTFSMV
ncbi:hypothetical protein NTE_00134 [Candidatus Nitrososphaera evergladensis SR1]|uniref:Uncharacterized protein n=1 Tax=Candidatus Nitrososphaera evergladensis SR1 TaxID=1459636 RepID=A0A075MLC9_9ARCH|nr:hypothetical protein NTE_00134 [Candidatus Nitrososphaera evergladensis SR1]